MPPQDPKVPDPEERAGSPAIVDEERLNDPEKIDTDIPDIASPDPDGAEEVERPVERPTEEFGKNRSLSGRRLMLALTWGPVQTCSR